MRLKDLHLKLKALKLRRLLLIGQRKKRREIGSAGKKPSWMRPIFHGYHVIEDHQSSRREATACDSVVVQREQVEENIDLWFFGVFDCEIGDRITKHLQSHLFDNLTKESQVRRKSTKEAMRKAYLSARAKIKEGLKPDEILRIGSASALVINTEKLLVAGMGDYRAVVCRDGMAHDPCDHKHRSSTPHWAHRLFSGWNSKYGHKKVKNGSSELGIRLEKIDSDTEFVIIGSNGIWEVMKKQEAVSLVRHMENPQEAAECLTMEALTRMSKSNISCLVIRFD